jgi:hypothetical protein
MFVHIFAAPCRYRYEINENLGKLEFAELYYVWNVGEAAYVNGRS